jgi:hypothetical protein
MNKGRSTLGLLAAAAMACHRPAPSPESTASSAAASSSTPSSPVPPSPAPAIAASASPDVDPRPIALSQRVPIDDPDAGYAAPTGIVPDCEDKLRGAGVSFRTSQLPPHTQRGVTCGAPQVVTYLKGPSGITYAPAPLLTCAMALALSSFESIVQQEASRTLKSTVVRIDQIGTYNCREIVAVKGLASEHSYANAIDLTRFTLANGMAITVLTDFDTSEGPPARPAGIFLRAVSQRAHRENVFSNVLTPFWDPAHKNHFHLDLARYRVDGVDRRPP